MRSWTRFLFRADAVLPAKRLVFFLIIGVAFVGIGSLFRWGWLFFAMINGALAGIAMMDGWLLRNRPVLKAVRDCPAILEMEEENGIDIRLEIEGSWTGRMWIHDDYPAGFQSSETTISLNWRGERQKRVSYQVKPHRRGKHRFGHITIRMESPWKLWMAQTNHPNEVETVVYPRLHAVRRVRKGWVPSQEETEGAPIKRPFGMGRQLSYLREYQPDDDPRFIDWKATAKNGKLISKVWIPERGQHTAIMIDCGRMMGKWQDGCSQLDRVLEAAWGTAAMALKHGDSVSLIAFSDQIVRFVPPQRGMAQLKRIMDETFDLEPTYAEADYPSAWRRLEKALPNHSLVVVFTDLTELAYSEPLAAMLAKARKNHRVMTVSIEEPHLRVMAEKEPENEEQVYSRLVAEHLLQERKNVRKRWNRQSIFHLDVPPYQLASQAIDTYLSFRKS